MDAKNIRAMLKDATSHGQNLYMKALRPASMPEHWFRVIGAKQQGALVLVRIVNGEWLPASAAASFDIR